MTTRVPRLWYCNILLLYVIGFQRVQVLAWETLADFHLGRSFLARYIIYIEQIACLAGTYLCRYCGIGTSIIQIEKSPQSGHLPWTRLPIEEKFKLKG